MKKPNLKLWPNLPLKTWGIVGLFTCLFLTSVIIGNYLHRNLSRLPSELAKKASLLLGYEVEIEGISISGFSSHIKSVSIATNPQITIKDIHLRLFLDILNLEFSLARASGTIKNQTIDVVSLQNIYQHLKNNIERTKPNSSQVFKTARTIPDVASIKMENIRFLNLFPKSIEMNQNNHPLISLGNITLQKKDKSLSYQIKLGSHFSPPHIRGIKGKIFYLPADGHFHFKNILVQNKTQDHPQISGVFNMDDDDYWTIDTVLSATSLEYFKSYSSIFKDSTIESIAFRVKFKTNDHVIHFKGSLKLNQLVLANKILAKEALDPISPLIQLHGIWNYQDKKIDVVNSHMLLQTDEDPPKQIRFKFETRTDFNSSIYGNWQGTLSLPKTSCQDFFDQIPPNFIPNIKAFSWSGHLSFALPLELNTSGPEHLAMDFSNFDFSCETQNTPIEFTAEHLKSPFIIERKQTDSGDYVKIPLNFPQVHLPLGAVHPYFRRALIASEDIKFWTHPGIDWEAIKNATDLNLHEKRVVLGGSTITMQTAKNLYLNFDRNLSRKFEEILIAWHLEKIFTKKQILETYINIVEFGPNIFGLKNAAKHFFDKSPENLNLLESVYLGSILPSPIKRYRHFCEGRISQGFQQDLNEKIGKLVNFNFIDQWEGEKASKMTLTFHRPEGIEDSTLCQRSLALSSSR